MATSDEAKALLDAVERIRPIIKEPALMGRSKKGVTCAVIMAASLLRRQPVFRAEVGCKEVHCSIKMMPGGNAMVAEGQSTGSQTCPEAALTGHGESHLCGQPLA